ncbi:ABC transporter ATP-binding protein [Thermocrinis sp.]|uniref:ABC transporter ATP-binding protein n=1 Tax=Thermocrinis sp. TaxID=2024383 RepID=UPI002FDE4109
MWKWDNSEVHLELEGVRKTFGSVSAVKGISLKIYKGEFFSLLGPSGSGKSTILRLIAGLERPDEGTIRIEGKVVASKESWVPPEKRGVGLVFQNYALFPHMTVFENVAYGISYLPKQEVKRRVRELLEMVGLAHKEKHYPHQLSGGEQQRVALARALAVAPKVMLLDEPFSNLDADLRRDLRKQTKKILKELGTTTILVTHDQEEALSLSDRIGVINGGVLEQVGIPFEVYHRPATRFVADFLGMADFYKGRVEGGILISEIGNFSLDGQWKCKSEEVEIMIRPDDVDFEPDPQGEAVIVEVEFLGADIIYSISLPEGKLIHSVKTSRELYPVGTKVRVKIDPNHLVIF